MEWRLSKYDVPLVCIGVFVVAIIGGLIALAVRDHNRHVSGIRSGVVYEKEYHPAWTQFIWIQDGNGIGHLQPIIHPPNWSVDIAEGSNTNGFSVSQETWSGIAVGDYLQFNADDEIKYHKRNGTDAE